MVHFEETIYITFRLGLYERVVFGFPFYLKGKSSRLSTLQQTI